MSKPLRVLIIEDEPEDVLLTLAELRRGGYEPRSLYISDREGLITALDGEWDVVLCELNLPAFDAPTALSVIRDRSSELPVIVVSSDVDEEIVVDLVRCGATDLVKKQNISRLVPAVRRALSESAAVRARLQAEDALEQSERRYRSLFKNLPVGVFRVGPGGRILSANPAFREMLGLKNSYEVMRSRVDEFVVDMEQILDIRRTLFKGTQRNDFEVHMRRRSGVLFWAHVFVSAARDENGRVIHVEGIMQDINKRMVLEKALLRGKKEWESAFDAVRELLLLVDLNGDVVRSNRAVAQRIHVDVRSIPGSSCLDILEVEDDDDRRRFLLESIRSGSSHDIDVSSETLGGEFRFSITPRVGDDGQVVGAILVGRDVTIAHQEEQLERLRGAIDQVERVFRTLRHEIGNILNTLKMTLSVFRMKIDVFDSRQRATYFERCFATLGIAEGLLRSLRRYQTFDRLNLKTIHLGDFLDQRLDLVFDNARAVSVACERHTCGHDVYIRVDADALVRILVNLFENAIAAVADSPDPTISVRCHSGKGSAVIEVSDNGCGIAEEQLPLVFAPLYTTKAEGSGMGLAVVQKLMVNMGGIAEIQSNIESGTTVVLRLPLVDPDDPEMAAES